jgi:hypothetical protein
MILNLGSGKDWMRDAINADINPAKNPDWVLDITKVPWGERIFTRHGEHLVEPGMFEVIIANDVLEHIPDLVTAMTNCNEKSWLYYTDWSWYVGWKDRFYLQSMEFELSDIGVKMAQEEGLDINQLSVVPRAIDAMRIILTKKP